MVGNIARIVAQFKQSWSRELEDDAIVRACEEVAISGVSGSWGRWRRSKCSSCKSYLAM